MELSEVMIQFIKSVLTGEKLAKQTIDEMQLHNLTSNSDLYRLSASHSIANVVSIGLLQNGFEIENSPFEKAELMAAVSDAEIEAAMRSIRTLFEKNRIVFLPLKALVLKDFYPETSMRTCGDIDILVREEDVKAAVDCLTGNLGYKSESYNFHDILMTAEGYPAIELHFSTCYDEERLDAVLEHIWDYAIPVNGGCEYKLSDDFFLFYTIAHIYHHFVTGGCGVRFFMDLWVIKHRMGIQYSDGVRVLCREAGIEKFAESVLRLSDVWFGEAEHTKLTLAMQEYILSGGTFGNKENAAARTAITEKKKGRIRYNLNRMLLPYDKLAILYPEMRSWQFPIYEVKRWGELLKKGANHRVMLAQESGELSEAKKESVKELFCELGID